MAAAVAPMATRKRKRAVLQEEDKEKEEEKNLVKELTAVLKKARDQRTDGDRALLRNHPDHVIHIQKRLEKYRSRKARQEEYEEPESVIADKSAALAEAIRTARHLVVYTGAGVSTSASIPDYRGPDGIWTRLSQGRGIGEHDLTAADPTLTHMALYGLWQRGLVRHVVSQNCDGLHLRSGLPKRHMSELHGNMYLEVCASCPRQYVRSFDVTPKTSRQNHKTGRRCYECGTPLIDTVVHFGERGSLRWPLNWRGACRQARRSDVILCLGSSLKVLRKYSGLWCMHRPPHKRPRLFIVNLQWTPKDDCAALKINGRCDDVMLRVMEQLGVEIPRYSRAADPLFRLATPLHRSEPPPPCCLTRPDTPPPSPPPGSSPPTRTDEADSRLTRPVESPSCPARRETTSPRLAGHEVLSPRPARREARQAGRPGAQAGAAPGRPAECAVSPQSPPLRLPEGGSLLLQTLLAGRTAAPAAAGSAPPESAARRRWSDVTAADVLGGDVTCAVTELRHALVQTDPIEWREEEFTVVESLEETACSSESSTCSEPGHSPDGRCSDLSHIRLLDGDSGQFCLSDDCLDQLSTSDVIFIDVTSAAPSLVDHDYIRLNGDDSDDGDSGGGGGGGGVWPGQVEEGPLEGSESVDWDGGPTHPNQSSQSPVRYADAASQMEAQESDSQAGDASQTESLAGDSASQSDSQFGDGASQIDARDENDVNRVESRDENRQTRVECQDESNLSRIESQDEDSLSRNESQDGRSLSRIESQDENSLSRIESQDGHSLSRIESQDENSLGRIESQDGNSLSRIESQDGSSPSRIEYQDGNSPSRIEYQDENSPSRIEYQDENSAGKVESHDEGGASLMRLNSMGVSSQVEFPDSDSAEAMSRVESRGGEAASEAESPDEDAGCGDHAPGGAGRQESHDGFNVSQRESEDDDAASQSELQVDRDVWMEGDGSSHDSRLGEDTGQAANSRDSSSWLDGADFSQEGVGSIQRVNSILEGTDCIQESTDSIRDVSLIPEGADSIRGDIDSIQDRTDSIQGGADSIREGADSIQDGADSIQDGADSSQEGGDSSREGEPAVGSGAEESASASGRRRSGRACSRRAVSYRDPSSSSSDSNDSDSDSAGPPPELAASSESSGGSSDESDAADYVRFQAVFRVSRRLLKPVLSQDSGAATGAGWYGRGCKARRKQRRLR